MADAIVFPLSGPAEVRNFSGFREYQQVLGGTIGYMHINNDVSAYVHDEGLLIGLEPNLPGTRAVLRLMGARGPEWLEWNGPLRGPVIVIGGTDDEGETLDVPNEVVDLLT